VSVRSWKEYEKHLLLGGVWLPVTSVIVFANASVEACVAGLESIRRIDGDVLFTSRRVHGDDVSSLLSRLLPLEAGQSTKQLFMNTTDPDWTAVFDSNWRGLEPWWLMKGLASAGITSVAVWDSPHTVSLVSNEGFYGIRAFTTAQPSGADEPNWGSIRVRSASLRTWELDGPGGFPLGLDWDSDARRIPDKFTHGHLVSMAARYGLRPFDEDFYAPDHTGVIIDRHVDESARPKETTLAAARGEEPIDF